MLGLVILLSTTSYTIYYFFQKEKINERKEKEHNTIYMNIEPLLLPC